MLDSHNVQCPYCWETIEIVIDPSESEQHYIEDCSVCCRPIQLQVSVTKKGKYKVKALSDDEY